MTTIFWAGDSTVKQNTILTFPQTGIGQAFDLYTRRYHVQIANFAENGRSTKQFIDEGRLIPIYDQIKQGDFLFIQFGHNDEKVDDPARYADPDGEFCVNLEKFVNVARNKGAYPVLITPLTRRNFRDPSHKFTHDRWAQAMRRTGEKLSVPVVDLTKMSEELVDSLPPEQSAKLYMNIPAGVYRHYPEGKTDDTHLQPEGAIVFAGLIARGLKQLGGVYADLLCTEYDQWMEEQK